MACILLESFDTYATGNYTGKWSSMAGTITTGGRNGTNCLTHTTLSGLLCPISNKQTIIVGIALKLDSLKAWDILELRDGTGIQLGVYTDPSNQIIIKRGSTTLSSTGYSLSVDTWIYLEFKGTIHNSTGSYELRINGVTIDSQSGIDTQQTGNAYITNVYLRFSGIGASNHYLDDIYIFDDTGSFCNNFVGDVYVEAVFPDADGYENAWVAFPGGGDNYEEVDETDPDSDTTFVVTSGVGFIDSYSFGNLVSTSGSIYTVQVNLWARKDDAGSRTLNAITRPTVTTFSGVDPISLGNTYAYSVHHFDYNPQTAGNWTIAQINAAEFGIKLEA